MKRSSKRSKNSARAEIKENEYKDARTILNELRGVGPEFEPDDLDAFFQAFMADPSSAIQPLQALTLIAQNITTRLPDDKEVGNEPVPWAGLPPNHEVRVPWWVVLVIAQAWNHFLANSDRQTMAQAFGIESVRPGHWPKLKRLATMYRKRDIALEVAALVVGPDRRRGEVTRAIEIVAGRHEIDTETVRKAWGEFGERAMQRLRDWRRHPPTSR